MRVIVMFKKTNTHTKKNKNWAKQAGNRVVEGHICVSNQESPWLLFPLVFGILCLNNALLCLNVLFLVLLSYFKYLNKKMTKKKTIILGHAKMLTYFQVLVNKNISSLSYWVFKCQFNNFFVNFFYETNVCKDVFSNNILRGSKTWIPMFPREWYKLN